ncbi:MAG: hypothetical protein R2856_33205 [Caldilineaceae bacterium]
MVVDRFTQAAAILTENVDVDAAMLTAAGTSLRLVARLDTGKPPLPKHRWTWSICPIRRWWAWPNMLCC